MTPETDTQYEINELNERSPRAGPDGCPAVAVRPDAPPSPMPETDTHDERNEINEISPPEVSVRCTACGGRARVRRRYPGVPGLWLAWCDNDTCGRADVVHPATLLHPTPPPVTI